jgi:predicted PurR-regulated permease PerM
MMDIPAWIELIKGFFTSMAKDAKLTPHTTLSTIMLWMVVWGFGALLYISIWPQVTQAAETAKAVTAVAQQAQALNNSMSELKAGLAIERWERQLEKIRNEIFLVEQDVEGARARAVPVSMNTLQHLNSLRIDEKTLAQKIENFARQNEKLLDPTL